MDTTLVRRPDGTVAPKVAAVDLVLSKGGAGSAGGPFARLAYNGNEVGLSWESDLPEPILAGSTATYPDVLAGVYGQSCDAPV